VAIHRPVASDEQVLDIGGNPTEENNSVVVGHRFVSIKSGSRGMNLEAADQTKEITTHAIMSRNDSLTRKVNGSYWFTLGEMRYDIVAAPDEGLSNRLFCRFDCRVVDGGEE
jgi:hypothetical protein